jgi:hypothetical protein
MVGVAQAAMKPGGVREIHPQSPVLFVAHQ